jgi:hypothetical protein
MILLQFSPGVPIDLSLNPISVALFVFLYFKLVSVERQLSFLSGIREGKKEKKGGE